MNFGTNKSLIEVIKKGSFEGTCVRDIYSNINSKWYKNSWKEFNSLKNIDTKCSSNFYDTKINKYGIKCGTSLRFWENKGWIHPNEPMGGFSGILDIIWVEDLQMMKGK